MTDSVRGSADARPLSLEDLNTAFSQEPRISHKRLATALGYQQPNNLLRLIERSRTELSRYGEVSSTVEETGPRGGRPGILYYLNEAQAILVTIKSDAPRSPDAREEIIRVFLEYRYGQLAKPHPGRLPPHPRAVPRKDGRYLVSVVDGRIAHVRDVAGSCVVDGANALNVRTFLREYLDPAVLPVALEMISYRVAVCLHYGPKGAPSPWDRKGGRR